MYQEKRYKRTFLAALIGTAVVAVCCFTPVLVILLEIVGLSAFTPYLDYVLVPASCFGNPNHRLLSEMEEVMLRQGLKEGLSFTLAAKFRSFYVLDILAYF